MNGFTAAVDCYYQNSIWRGYYSRLTSKLWIGSFTCTKRAELYIAEQDGFVFACLIFPLGHRYYSRMDWFYVYVPECGTFPRNYYPCVNGWRYAM